MNGITVENENGKIRIDRMGATWQITEKKFKSKATETDRTNLINRANKIINENKLI